MSRTRILHDLPPLRSFPASRPGENRAGEFRKRLRALASSLRQAHPQPFYTMREVAAHFGLPLQTVSRTYAALESEGLLTRVRSSHTLLRGSQQRPRRSLRSVVGMPVLLPAFVGSREWRTLFITLEEELRRHSFIGDFIFFQNDEDLKPEFFSRLRHRRLDAVIWFVPPAGARQNVDRLRDAGIQVVIAGQDGDRFPDKHYSIQYRSARLEGLDAWKTDGIEDVILYYSTAGINDQELPAFSEALRMYRSALQHRHILYRTLDAAADRSGAELRRCIASRTPLILLRPSWYHNLWLKEPDASMEMFRRCRVMLTHDVGDVSGFADRKLRADVITGDFAALAAVVVGDLHADRVPKPGQPREFLASWYPHRALCPPVAATD